MDKMVQAKKVNKEPMALFLLLYFMDLIQDLLYYLIMEKLSEMLPNEFCERMKSSLGKNYQKYLDAINSNAVRGLRVNTKRISVQDFIEKYDYNLKKLNFADDGFILNSDDKLGGSFEHLSGLIYLQEPSSMLSVCSSGIEKDNRPLKVLDLCASPGGKSGQIASRISEESILFSNEIISSRANVLFSNIERLGLKNVVVLNEKPENLLSFENYFDYVFVDAPCSGEGMFRKNPETIQEWSKSNVEMCAERQKEILKVAEKLVGSGGKLVYSTCTFAEKEDEQIVEWFLDNFNFKLADVPQSIKDVTVPSNANVKNGEFARKFYPFVSDGEGQFVAVFECLEDRKIAQMHTKKHFNAVEEIGRTNRIILDKFFEDNTTFKITKRPYEVGTNLFLAPELFDANVQTTMDSLKFVSLGVKLGAIEKGRFEPNHNIFMAMSDYFKLKIELSDVDAKKYLHGEEISTNQSGKGYVVVTKNGYPLGGAKLVNGKLKNLYPKGLRVWVINTL